MPDPTSAPKLDGLYELLAAIQHDIWSHWMRYLLGTKACIDRDGMTRLLAYSDVEQWRRQIDTPYADLTEREKASDREQVDRFWPLIAERFAAPPAPASAEYAEALAYFRERGPFPGLHQVHAATIVRAALADGRPSGAEIRRFVNSRYGDRGPFMVAAKLAEEAGEVLGAALKREEGRTDKNWTAELHKEIGDAGIVLAQLADAEGTDLDTLITERWAQVLDRAARPDERTGGAVSGERSNGPLTGAAVADVVREALAHEDASPVSDLDGVASFLSGCLNGADLAVIPTAALRNPDGLTAGYLEGERDHLRAQVERIVTAGNELADAAQRVLAVNPRRDGAPGKSVYDGLAQGTQAWRDAQREGPPPVDATDLAAELTIRDWSWSQVPPPLLSLYLPPGGTHMALGMADPANGVHPDGALDWTPRHLTAEQADELADGLRARARALRARAAEQPGGGDGS